VIGFDHRGWRGPDGGGRFSATGWFEFLWLPIFPTGRWRFRRDAGGALEVEEATPLALGEIVRTYALWWIGIPLLLFGPMLPALEEFRIRLGMSERTQQIWIGVGIAWVCVWVWKLADWRDAARARRGEEAP
jgi:hypothetical protein